MARIGKQLNKGIEALDVNENTQAAKLSRELMGYVRSGLAYLDRYGGPRLRVERALSRRARRKGLETEAAAEIVILAMAKLDAMEVMDDRAFATSKARGLRGRGTSGRAALAKLMAAGVPADLAVEALAAEDADLEDPERAAAERYAQRRRFGPWHHDSETRVSRRDKDIAAMARAGFPVRIAIDVIDENNSC